MINFITENPLLVALSLIPILLLATAMLSYAKRKRLEHSGTTPAIPESRFSGIGMNRAILLLGLFLLLAGALTLLKHWL